MARPLSFVFVVPRFHTNLFSAVRALKDAGHRVSLICRDQEGIEDHSVVGPIYPGLDASVSDMAAILRPLAPDLVIIRRVRGLSDRVFLAAVRAGYRRIAYDQQPYLAARPPWRIITNLLKGLPHRRFTPVLGLDESSKPDRFSTYIPFPIEIPLELTRDYAPESKVRLLCVGKLSQPRKNQRMLIEVLKKLRHLGRRNFLLTLAGSSKASINEGDERYLQSLRAEASSGSLSGHITILSDVPFSDMGELYRSHDICVLPAINEPLGTAPQEAMGYGCVPVISSSCGSAGYLKNLDCGFIVDPASPQSIERVLGDLFSDPVQVEKLGKGARASAAGRFSDGPFVRRMEKLANASRD
jgi:glycosyltransferase involved in cell wall biosynthesis